MGKLASNVLFVLICWAQLFVVAHEFLGLTWACAAMLPFTFLGWAWCTPLDERHATAAAESSEPDYTETIGSDYVQVIENEASDAPPSGEPENN